MTPDRIRLQIRSVTFVSSPPSGRPDSRKSRADDKAINFDAFVAFRAFADFKSSRSACSTLVGPKSLCYLFDTRVTLLIT